MAEHQEQGDLFFKSIGGGGEGLRVSEGESMAITVGSIVAGRHSKSATAESSLTSGGNNHKSEMEEEREAEGRKRGRGRGGGREKERENINISLDF